jgi:hypothetical protein
MALPFSLADRSRTTLVAPLASAGATLAQASHDARALRILAKTIYRELRQGGLAEEDVMAIAGDMLGLVAGEVKDRRRLAEDEAPR